MTATLSVSNHDRDKAGLIYVYPVISRRAGGLSIGVNFNINNACNWRCIYCQVPDLGKGSAPDLDLAVLDKELTLFLADVLQGDFYQRFNVAEDNREIKDIALSGNGEPTSAKNFAEAVELIGTIATKTGVFPDARFVLITNGSLIDKVWVRPGLKILQSFGGEIWFKLDSVTRAGRLTINQTRQSVAKSLEYLTLASQLCPTKIQTCWFDYGNDALRNSDLNAYLAVLEEVKASTDISEILLYTLARPSQQPEANKLKSLPETQLNQIADQIRQLGFQVSVFG